MRLVTWNENVMYAGQDGHIAYWHPGLHPRRSPLWDQRFPAPGTGEYDHQGFLPFEQLPHSIDPKVGYLANWNNKPAQGWADDYLDPASSRSAGKAVRVQVIQQLLAAEPRLTPARLRTLEYELGTTDQRTPEFFPLVKSVIGRTAVQQRALALVRGVERPQLRSRRGHQLHLVRRRDRHRRARADDLPAPDGRPARRRAPRPAASRWWSPPTTAAATSSTAPRRTTWCCASCVRRRAR